ncbi:glutamate-cysteine ligase, catalytic subunit domain-containing protein [Cardiosporidium cionae]|uniref:Glutamate--cysteine ligase n=1 Tax=Cardiosporidium cionae TaxID=476202 RepID=A0ABQ7JFA9_9APIC|nr:glutamate-cysteine ligase, catalytic subunit domain-containing protein [Cardiosporidium cionae]|eukprot:KAF8822695.1 glutamate-cysteine ligase, catalytic subunit domain-containing protein [Cardiosporidium cionae]
MGLLERGTCLDWENDLDILAFIKEKGVEQFIALYQRHSERHDSPENIKWGEEVEFLLVQFDDDRQEAYVFPQSSGIYDALFLNPIINHLEQLEQCTPSSTHGVTWHHEYGSFSVEATPRDPYPLDLDSVLLLHQSMNYRRWKLKAALPLDADATTLTCFPLLGSTVFLKETKEKQKDRIAKSLFLPDEIISHHPRFASLTKNIYLRRGKKVQILVPLYLDENTNSSIKWDNSDADTVNPLKTRYPISSGSDSDITQCNPVQNAIYMDAMGFGMGMGCCQATYMCNDLSSARYLYDQFAVLSPLWLAMTACTPFFRGMIAATDTRWDVIAASVDCRHEEEMEFIKKSRFSSISLYISDAPALVDHLEEYNDLDLPINQKAYTQLLSAGIDPILAKHVAYLFIRDPVILMTESLDESHSLFLTHFDNIQSSNWNSVRFKPPPSFTDTSPHQEIGWRVEFRTPDLQLTDFENAAFVALLTVLTQILKKERLDLYIPMSLNDDNFRRSSGENAIVKEKFWFRRDISCNAQDRSYTLQSLQEIFLGGDDFLNSGFIPPKSGSPALLHRCIQFVAEEYLSGKCTEAARDLLNKYFDFICMRICGRIETNATFLRNFVKAHPDYKRDSIVPVQACYDVCRLASEVGYLSMYLPELFGSFAPKCQCNSANFETAQPLSLGDSAEFVSNMSSPSSTDINFKALCHEKNSSRIDCCELSAVERNLPLLSAKKDATSASKSEMTGEVAAHPLSNAGELSSAGNSFFTAYSQRYLFSLCAANSMWRRNCFKVLEPLRPHGNLDGNVDDFQDFLSEEAYFLGDRNRKINPVNKNVCATETIRQLFNEQNTFYFDMIIPDNKSIPVGLMQYWLFCHKLRYFMIDEQSKSCWAHTSLEATDDLSTCCASLGCLGDSCSFSEVDRGQS